MQVGVLDDVLTNVDNVIRKGRLGPGQTLVADLSSGTFKENMQIAKEVGSRAPYEEWLSTSTRLKDLNASGYSRECLMQSADVRTFMYTNFAVGTDPASMNDSALHICPTRLLQEQSWVKA